MQMRKLGVLLIAACITFPCHAQTLRETLQRFHIPSTSFSGDELSQTIDAADASRNGFTYLACILLERNGLLSGFPRIVRYDSRNRQVIRSELHANEEDNCCGSPLGIDFTQDYLLISFHDNPSASTVLVTDSRLRLIGVLYGFDFHEVAPNQVVFIENMVHFAAQHPERLRLLDLRGGYTQELYPLKGDSLRAAFARTNQHHLPTQAACRQANDPCDPDTFDETIQFVSSSGDGSFQIQVVRDALHPWVSNWRKENHLTASAIYIYRRTDGGWLYCETQPEKGETCTPNLPAVADPSGEPTSFPAFVRKVK
jgi:hypothetical protein